MSPKLESVRIEGQSEKQLIRLQMSVVQTARTSIQMTPQKHLQFQLPLAWFTKPAPRLLL